MSSFSHYRVKSGYQIPEILPSPRQQHDSSSSSSSSKEESYVERLRSEIQIKVTKLAGLDMEFDLIGVDASVANALRRILLAEVPTIAIEKVWILINSSIIQDEVLAHRVGLIPIKVDPNKLEYVVKDDETVADTLVFHYDVQCESRGNAVINDVALSGSLEWAPHGNQEEVFPEGVRPVHEDIVVAKLRPGQRIEFEAHCRKGIGKDHTKFSPVATASYRLLPDIKLMEPIVDELADQLKAMCPTNVFDIEDLGGGVRGAVVSRPRDCTMCRECIRHVDQGWDSRIQLRRHADYFLFSVEAVGSIPPEVIVMEAISILKAKGNKFLSLVDDYESQLQ